jgi:hypothetical protein
MNNQDPNKEPIGRQPLTMLYSPSKAGSYYWWGSLIGAEQGPLGWVGGERFTDEQQRELIRLGRDIPTATSMLVKRQAFKIEIYRGDMDMPEVFAFECPLLGITRADGRVKVIAPNGAHKYVLPDGWVSYPYRKPQAFSLKEQR